MKKLESKIKLVWTIGQAIFFVVILTAYLVFLLGKFEGIDLKIIHAIFIPILIISGLFIIIYPSLKYHYYSYSYDQTIIKINKGIIFRNKILIPVIQIQDLHLNQGPIMLLFKLASFEVSTAGSNYVINGLKYQECEKMVNEIHEFLENRIEEIGYEKI